MLILLEFGQLQMKSTTYQNENGFSFLELTLSIVVVSILAMVAISRTQTDDTDVIGQYEVIKSHLRYAQARAMNSDSVWGLAFTGGQLYGLFRYDQNQAAQVAVLLPGEKPDISRGGAYVIDLAERGVSVSPAETLISFDSWGRPCNDEQGLTPLGGDLTITVSSGSGTTRNIIITKNTGFIP